MFEPLVSIVIPLYNKDEWIFQTLDSVYKQTYRNWECIVINDGSTDQSLNQVENFISRYPGNWQNVTIANSGQTVARNLGIQISKGELIAFLDADDLWHPDKLNSQVNLFGANTDLELVLSPYVIFKENQLRGYRLIKLGNPIKLVENWLSLRGFGGLIESSGMVRKSTLTHLGGFRDGLSMSAGLDLSLKVIRSRLSVMATEPYVYYRLSNSQFHKNEEILISDLEIISAVHSNSPKAQDKLKIGYSNYFYWSESKGHGKFRFIQRILRAILCLDLPKLSMLYSLTSRNVVAIIRGFCRQKEIRQFLRTYRAMPQQDIS